MLEHISRRLFLGTIPGLSLTSVADAAVPDPVTPGSEFPAQDPAAVKEAVVAAHGNVARIKELVTARPALARSAWDWGFGDWETALDGASHVGHREIAEFLIANGARPTIYTAAMLGQLAIVKGLVEAIPGVQRNRGPHGITLLAHARAGGPAASDVVRYLEALGDADPRYANEPLSDAEQAAILGEYRFGAAASERLIVARNARGGFTITRAGMTERPLFHQGGLVFNPAGAEAVRIRFRVADQKAARLVVEDGGAVTEATRVG
jgi:hypothetical protein